MATFTAVAGTQFKYTVSAALTLVPGVGALSGSGGEKKDIDVTAISDEDEVFIGGRRSFREFAFPMYFDPTDAVHVAMLAAYDAGNSTPVAMSIVESDAGANTLTFSGYIKQFQLDYDKDGAIMRNVVIKVTTAVTSTP